MSLLNKLSGKDPQALMLASRKGNLEVVQALLEKGADVKAKACGYTALEWATRGGHWEVMELLKNADLR